MEIIIYLGNVLSENIKISPLAARGLLKLAIINEVGPYKPFNKLNLTEFIDVIQNSLRKRLEKLKIGDIDIIIQEMFKELIDNQSLITIASI